MPKLANTTRRKTLTHTGGCLCGAVRFRARGNPTLVDHCHCSMCRKASGAPVVTSANFPAESFAWTKGKLKFYRSSPKARRGFCAKCGSQLTFRFDKRTDYVSVNVGCLDRPERVKPQCHIFVDTMIPWLHMKDGLPRHRRGVLG
jgi:hypothetical protein